MLSRWSCVLSVLLCCAPSFAFAAAFKARPNIVFIITDDQGYGDLGRHGNPILKTPHLDRLYDQSVRFTDFHVSPTCSPTRSALMTGRHEFRNGVTHTINERERLTLQATTIAQVLKQADYRTGVFGKWHLGDEDEYQPDRRGFDEVFIHGGGGIGQTYVGSCGDAPGNKYFNPAILHNGKFEKTDGYCTDVFFRQAESWIRSLSREKPFFAYIATNAPHGPLDCPADYEARYEGKVPPNVAKFFGMISNIDDNVGRLLAMLDEQRLTENTIVVFMNDNGGTAGTSVWNAGMRGQKGTAYLGGTRAMSLWRWSGKWQPHDVKNLAAHIDIFPTLAELGGGFESSWPKEQIEGHSLAPLLQGEPVTWPDRTLFTHLGRWPTGEAEANKYRNASVRWRNYHLVRATAPAANPGKKNKGPSDTTAKATSAKEADRWQLFDLASDPSEQHDLATREPAVVQQLDQAYDRWWTSIQPGLVNEAAGKTAPKWNPFHERYWRQFRGPGPNGVAPPAGFVLTNE